MTDLAEPHAEFKRPTASVPMLDDTWQPIGLVVRRLMKRLGLPRPTAILTAEAAGYLEPKR